MHYLYHGAPDPMIGDKLIPLNKMKASLPELYHFHKAKYEGREEILERKIPLINCLWNDVVQFTPVHPRKIFELQVKLGLIPAMPRYRFFEIDAASLDPKKTVVFFKTAPGEDHTAYEWLSDVDFAALQDIPPATIAYFKSLKGTGELPFNYQFVPHVVYKGFLDVSKARIITI